MESHLTQQQSPETTPSENRRSCSSTADVESAVLSSMDSTAAEIYLLKDRFKALLSEFESSLDERNIKVCDIIKYLKYIPLSDNLQLQNCIPNISNIFEAKSKSELFFVLARSWDYLHLGVLEHLINQYGTGKNKQNMQNYLVKLNDFRGKILVHNFVQVNIRTPENFSELFYCVQIKSIMNEKWETATLQDVEELRSELPLNQYKTTWVKAYPVLSSIGICFSIPYGMELNLQKMVPLLISKGVIKVFFKDKCIVDCRIKVGTCM